MYPAFSFHVTNFQYSRAWNARLVSSRLFIYNIKKCHRAINDRGSMRLTNVGLRITTPDCLLSKRGYVEHECERTRVTGIKDGKCVLQVYLGSCGGGGKMEDELVIVCKEAAFEPLGWFLNKMAKGGDPVERVCFFR